MRDVYLIGVDMMKFGKHLDKSIKQMTALTVEGVFQDAGIPKDRIEAAWFSNSGWGRRNGQDAIRGEIALRPLGIERIPITNVENACAGGSTALNSAYMAVAGGFFDVALAVGVEKIYHEDKLRMFAGYLAGMDVENINRTLDFFKQYEAMISIRADQWPEEYATRAPQGKIGQDFSGWVTGLPSRVKARVKSSINMLQDAIVLSSLFGRDNFKALVKGGLAQSHSPFMDLYSLAARAHMDQYGTTQRQMAVVSAKNHFHSTLNPKAQYTRDMTVEQVLMDARVSFPLTRAMCAPVGDGAAAAIICDGERLGEFGRSRAVKIRASVLGSGRNRGLEEEDIAVRLAEQAYKQAGVGPNDIDVAELHDATSFGELHHCETLGFCGEGEGGPFADSGATRLGGRIPVNTSGGLESRGHPVGATGLAQIYELVTQLRGEAGPRQVEGARIALAQNGGGNIGLEEAAMCLHILEAPAKQ